MTQNSAQNPLGSFCTLFVWSPVGDVLDAGLQDFPGAERSFIVKSVTFSTEFNTSKRSISYDAYTKASLLRCASTHTHVHPMSQGTAWPRSGDITSRGFVVEPA